MHWIGHLTAIVIVLSSSFSQAAVAASISVSSDFPCGSANVLEINQKKRFIRIRPANHEKRGWACWWYLLIEGLTPGETITLEVGRAPWATPERAAVSRDNRSWTQTSPGKRIGNRIRYEYEAEDTRVWLAWGPPLSPKDARQLVEHAAQIGRTCGSKKSLCRCF